MTQQDFLYCKKLLEYETARKSKALSQAEIEVSEKRIQSTTDYAHVILNTCTNQPPSGLGIKSSTVLGARESGALKSYTDFQISTASSADWVVSMVAMIPCIQVRLMPFCHIRGSLTSNGDPQSYYQIAMNLNNSSTHKGQWEIGMTPEGYC